MCCRLIALDKNPGVCPIGVGEVVRRIIFKAVLSQEVEQSWVQQKKYTGDEPKKQWSDRVH